LLAQPERAADESEGATADEATEQRDRLRCDASSLPSKGPTLEEPLAETAQRVIAQGVLEGKGLRAAARGLWLRAFRLHWDPQAERSDRQRAWQLLLEGAERSLNAIATDARLECLAVSSGSG